MQDLALLQSVIELMKTYQTSFSEVVRGDEDVAVQPRRSCILPSSKYRSAEYNSLTPCRCSTLGEKAVYETHGEVILPVTLAQLSLLARPCVEEPEQDIHKQLHRRRSFLDASCTADSQDTLSSTSRTVLRRDSGDPRY